MKKREQIENKKERFKNGVKKNLLYDIDLQSFLKFWVNNRNESKDNYQVKAWSLKPIPTAAWVTSDFLISMLLKASLFITFGARYLHMLSPEWTIRSTDRVWGKDVLDQSCLLLL